MPTIEAFRGIRYDLGRIGSLSDVIAPPYDVIDTGLQDALYAKHPHNIIRLELTRDEAGGKADDKYARAARTLREWVQDGVMQADAQPALYVYHQSFDYAGQRYLRRGFMGRLKLEPLGKGSVYPHEETLAKAKEDRLKLTRACRTNISQIFGLYPDPTNEAQELLEKIVAQQPGWQAIDHLGVEHTMWPVTDSQTIAAVQRVLAGRPLFIADGHHRYETACNYQNELIAERGGEPLPPQHAANYVMCMFVSMADPGMIVLPTHRLLSGAPELSADDLRGRLAACFQCTSTGSGPAEAAQVWSQMETLGDQGTLGLYTARDQQWTLCRALPEAAQRMAQIAREHSEEWQGLGVSLLHRLVIEDLLGLKNLPKPTYVHLVDEVIKGLTDGGPHGERFQLAALVMPATVSHVEQISRHLERMPAKSTYFYPKLLSGLVLHSLEK
jgi:uncharacterized protein (DUF1015 family)